MTTIASSRRDNVYRIAAESMEVRAASDGKPAILSGYFAVFNSPTVIRSAWEGEFVEQVAPGAFTRTFAERGDKIKLLLEHGADPRVAQRPLGKITKLEEDSYGARYEAELFDVPYVNELLPALREGLFGASFRFKPLVDVWDDNPGRSDLNPDGSLPVRTLKEVSVSEFGPVLWGAYSDATAQARSLTDEYASAPLLLRMNRERFDEVSEFWRSRIPVEAPLENEARGEEPEPTENTSPAPESTEDAGRAEDADEPVTPSGPTTRKRVNQKSYLTPYGKEHKSWEIP